MDDDAPDDLRARRHLDTRQQVHEAALDLFEQQGVRGTTVEQIAERAGIGTRTFSRCFTSKEHAALPRQRALQRAIDELTLPPDAGVDRVLRGVEVAVEQAMGAADDRGFAGHRRVARLLRREPDLRAAAAAEELALTGRLRDRLVRQLPDVDLLTVQLVAEVAMATWRACWDRWDELAADGDADHPAELLRRCRAELRRIVG